MVSMDLNAASSSKRSQSLSGNVPLHKTSLSTGPKVVSAAEEERRQQSETNRKEISARSLPGHIEPIFCCGCRIGWFHSGIGDEGEHYCDECTADLSDDS